MSNLVHKIEEVPKDKKLIVFDLDGTLAESKLDIDEEMAGLIKDLLEKKSVAVIGGGKYALFQHQLVSKLNIKEELLKKLFPNSIIIRRMCIGKSWRIGDLK